MSDYIRIDTLDSIPKLFYGRRGLRCFRLFCWGSVLLPPGSARLGRLQNKLSLSTGDMTASGSGYIWRLIVIKQSTTGSLPGADLAGQTQCRPHGFGLIPLVRIEVLQTRLNVLPYGHYVGLNPFP
jgi:hypothetical protein